MSKRFTASAAERDKVHDPEKQAPRRDEKTNTKNEKKKDWAEELISPLLPQMDEERRKELIKKIRIVIPHIGNVIFEVSFVIGVAVDPLFFYIPVINEDDKCVFLNTKLYVIAVCFRMVTDLIHMAPTIRALSVIMGSRVAILRDTRAKKAKGTERDEPKQKEMRSEPEAKGTKAATKKNFLKWKVLISILAILPAPQVLGAFWYLFSVERVTVCWHMACRKQVGCTPSSSRCNHRLAGNYTFLNEHCPMKTPNSTAFDFGIFTGALQSGIVTSTNLPEKMVQCFWWGLRNLSSLGQNLQTSNNFWENCFAIFISIYGLLLFLFLIGNIQTYMQLAIETVEKVKQNMREKDPAIKLWMVKNHIKGDMQQRIMDCVKNKMQKGCDFDENEPLLHLSEKLKREITPLICLPLLKKVNFFEKASNKDDDVLLKSSCDALLKSICDALRPRYGNENSYIIREGEPLDEMLFINRGIICCYTSNQNNQTGCLKPGDFYGKELLDNWLLKSLPSSHPSNLSFSKMSLKCLTKVEAFSLKASDLKNIESRHPVKIVKLRQFNANAPEAEQKEQAEQLRRTAISFLREMRLSRQRRFPKLSHLGRGNFHFGLRKLPPSG